ncbi:M48 family metallopeptidase [Abyssogena phaseoliformis symbiont]|uniref:M48 family metallopeptidase n=1 Tax=Abyssogena phaseoliformis symbiont TaxID=596095 RepID=UPI001915BBC9|nr:M48 family metallopeptidase [Abyssogena phaseoliformis symbiont]
MSASNAISLVDLVTGKREINFESKAQEIKRANTQSKEIFADLKRKKIKIDNQSQYFSRIQRVFNRLKKVTHRADLPWEVHLIDNHQWNAFTLVGGKVFVYTGLFKGKLAVRSDDELAAYEASFTTNQEDEADKYSVIYSELAGYKPSVGAEIWVRMHKQLGSDSKDRLHDHSLNVDRVKA